MLQENNNLVIGSEGCIGKSLCEFLVSQNDRVTRFDIKRSFMEDARTHKFDLSIIDFVYFLAWEVGGSKYLSRKSNQGKQLTWNVDLLRNMMPQLSHTKFLFISTQLADRTDTAYGATKRLGEVWAAVANGVIVRLWNVYGGYEEIDDRSHVISDFISQALYNNCIDMLTTGEEIRQFVHMEDVCCALRILSIEGKPGVIYDLSSYSWVKIIDLAEIISTYTGAQINRGTKQSDGHVANNMESLTSWSPSTKLEPIPGWKASVSIEDGIKRSIKLYETMDE